MWSHCLQDGGQLYVSVAMTPSPEEPYFRKGKTMHCVIQPQESAAILPPNDKFVGAARDLGHGCAVHFTCWFKSLHFIQVRGHLHLAATMARQDPDSYEVFGGGKRVFRV